MRLPWNLLWFWEMGVEVVDKRSCSTDLTCFPLRLYFSSTWRMKNSEDNIVIVFGQRKKLRITTVKSFLCKVLYMPQLCLPLACWCLALKGYLFFPLLENTVWWSLATADLSTDCLMVVIEEVQTLNDVIPLYSFFSLDPQQEPGASFTSIAFCFCFFFFYNCL